MSGKVISLEIVDYKLCDRAGMRRFTEYTIKTEANTRFIHPLCLSDSQFPCFLIRSRYSELLHMHKQLLSSHPALNFPCFPSKRYSIHFSHESTMIRIAALNEYFENLLKIPVIDSSEPILKLIKPARQYTIKVLGDEEISQKLLYGFFSHQKFYELKDIDWALPVDFFIGKDLVRLQSIVFEDTQEADGNIVCSEEKIYSAVNELPTIHTYLNVADPMMAYGSVISLLQLIELYSR